MAPGEEPSDGFGRRPDYPSATGACPVRSWKPALPSPRGKDQRSPGPLLPEGIRAIMKAIADTGLIVAFGNRTDRFHPWAVDIAKSIREPLLTCEAVLAEAAFHLRSVPYVLSLVEDGMLSIAFETTKHRQRLAQL